MFKVSIKDVAAQSGGRQIVGACCGDNLTTQERICQTGGVLNGFQED